MFEKTLNWTSDRDYTLIVIQCPVEEEQDGANWDFSQIEIQISHQLWSIFLTNCDSDFSQIVTSARLSNIESWNISHIY